jgi:hypothetical protein
VLQLNTIAIEDDNLPVLTLSAACGAGGRPAGHLGMMEIRKPAGHALRQGAHAEMLRVKGDPTENLDLVADPDKNFRVIMKGGRVFKNTL